jgi:hypothetical protein
LMVGDWLNRFLRTHANTAHTTGVTGSGELGAGARNGLSRLVTTVFRKPTTPVTGATSCAVEATGAVTAAVVSALLVLAANAFAADTSLGSVPFADGCVTVVVDETLVVGDFVVAASTVVDCVGFDPLFAGVDGCSGSGADVSGGVVGAVGAAVSPESAGSLDFGGVSTTLGTVDDSGSVVLVCAPPLLLTVTPVPIWVLDDVAPDVELVPAVAVPVTVDPELVVVEPLSVDGAVEVPVLGVAAAELESVLVAELSCGVDDVLEVSALARPGEVATIIPIPNAAASAPTRPI